MKKTHYQMLGVPESATAKQIKLAYRANVVEHHPDRNGGDAAAAERLKAINAAYELLSDEQKRAEYDAELRAARARAEFEKRAAAVAGPAKPQPAGGPAPTAPVQVSQSSAWWGDLFFGAFGIAAAVAGVSAIAGGGSYYDPSVDRRRSKRTGRFRPG